MKHVRVIQNSDTNHDKLQTSLGVTQLLNLTILVYFGITRRYTSVCVLGGQKCKKHVDFGEHHFLKRTSLVYIFVLCCNTSFRFSLGICWPFALKSQTKPAGHVSCTLFRPLFRIVDLQNRSLDLAKTWSQITLSKTYCRSNFGSRWCKWLKNTHLAPFCCLRSTFPT